MVGNERKSGIEIIGDIPWGTHLCQFYQTREDLLDILVPYFKAGLENNEFCMWIASEPLTVDESLEAMRKNVPSFDRYLEKGQIQIIPYTSWYLKGGIFDSQRVLRGWIEKLSEALTRGYDGLRLTGNTFWLEKKDWRQFTDYEEEINRTIGRYRMIAICTYSLDRCGSFEVIDVVHNHQCALINRGGKWELIESSERKIAEEALQKERDQVQQYVDFAGFFLVVIDADQRVKLINRKGCEILGCNREEIIGKNWFDSFIPERAREEMRMSFTRLMEDGKKPADYFEHPVFARDGTERTILWRNRVLKDGKEKAIATISSGEDVTESKKAWEALRESEERFRAVIKGSPVTLFSQDSDLRYTWIYNPLLGYSPREVIGKTDLQIFPAKGASLINEIKERVVRSGAGADEEVKLETGHGIFWYRLLAEPILNESGGVTGLTGISIDITQRKKVEEALKFTQFSVDRAGEAIFWVDPDARFSYANDKACSSLGYSREELLSMYVYDIDPFFTKEVWPRHWEEIRKYGSFTIETVHRSKNGKMFPVEVTTNYIRLGEKEYNCAFARNITERKIAEEIIKKAYDKLESRVAERTAELRQLNEELRKEILERQKIEKHMTARNILLELLTKTFTRKEYLDEVVKLISSWSGSDRVGIRLRNGENGIPYEAFAGFSNGFWKAENSLSMEKDQCVCTRIFSGQRVPKDAQITTGFGSFCCNHVAEFFDNLTEEEKTAFRCGCNKEGFQSIAVIPIHYERNVIGAIHLADVRENSFESDVIEFLELLTPLIGEGVYKFNLTDEIRRSNELLERVFSSTNFLIAYLDTAFRFIRVNKAYAEADSRTPDSLAGRNYFDLYPDEQNCAIFRRVVETGQAYSTYEKPFIYSGHPERGITYWDWNLHPVKDALGRVEGLVLILVDRTSRKLAQEELFDMQRKLSEAKHLSDIGTLAATVAHELRNPLASIHVAAFNIKRKARNPLLESHLATIEKKVHESDQIINNLLSYSRLKPPQVENVHLHEIIDECIDVAKKNHGKTKATISRNYGPLKKISVKVDPLQMKEVFNNILNNAYDAMSGRKGRIHVQGEMDEQNIKIHTRDTGSGIDEEDLKRVFDPFFSTKTKGTGLGLSVCRQIMNFHGGEVNIVSRKGKGTTVTISLPRKRDSHIRSM